MTIGANPFLAVAGYCPMGCGTTLFLAEGGHITCSYQGCPNPSAVDEILAERETEHIVTIKDETFTIRHPLRERIEGQLEDCALHTYLSVLQGPPVRIGRYRVHKPATEMPPFIWERLS